jgi:general nucleoside transport system ATP-binding protein
MDEEYLLELEGITKRFFTLTANNNISLKVKNNEVLAILGENGAGKSTLMNILTGLYQPDSGTIKLKGQKIHIRSPKDAIAYGIGMVHQHFRLVDRLTVAENISIGTKGHTFIRWKKLKQEILEISQKFDLPVNPDAVVGNLSVGEKQRVEIIKILIRGCNILILDEPTSVLTPDEIQKLFKVLDGLKKNGKTILFISHKLNEIMQFSDRVAVLKRGELVGIMERKDINPKKMINMMVGKDIDLLESNSSEDISKSEVVLDVQGLKAKGDRGETIIDNVSFNIRKGEMLGIAAVSGNGQSQLAEVLTGVREALSGKIIFRGANLFNRSPKDFIKAGIASIPEDRIGTGIVGEFNSIENSILKTYRETVKKNGNINYKKADSICDEYKKKYNIMITSNKNETKLLSGGNIQKLILAREIESKPELIIAAHPTYGLDVSAVDLIWRLLVEQQKKGAAVLLISEDLDEIMQISNTVVVMFKGKLSEKRNTKECTVEEIGHMMMGVSEVSEVG